MSQTIELFPEPQLETFPSRRAIVALLIAVTLHAVLLTLPVTLEREPPAERAPINVTIAQPPKPEPVSAPPEPVEQSTEPALPAKPEPAAEPADPAPPPAGPKDTARTESRPAQKAPGTVTIEPIDQPETGAKSRSTVFDPRLAGKLDGARNRVQQFDSGNTEVMTATGTFIRKGNRCEEVKKLLPGDIDSNLSQPFKIKCTKRSRPQEDIDRLAREYGIP